MTHKIIEGKSKSLALKHGLFIYINLSVFFLAMKVMGLEDQTELRLFNIVIVLAGIYFLIKRNILVEKDREYISNFLLGARAAIFSVILSAVSLLIYLKWIDPSFLVVLENSLMWGSDLSIFQIIVAILIEGVASSVVASFIVMQFMKDYQPKKT